MLMQVVVDVWIDIFRDCRSGGFVLISGYLQIEVAITTL
jgi:hypothetical protein